MVAMPTPSPVPIYTFLATFCERCRGCVEAKNGRLRMCKPEHRDWQEGPKQRWYCRWTWSWSRSWNWGRYNWQLAHSWHKVVEMGRRMQALDPSDRPDLPSLRCIVAEFNKLNNLLNAPSRRLAEQF